MRSCSYWTDCTGERNEQVELLPLRCPAGGKDVDGLLGWRYWYSDAEMPCGPPILVLGCRSHVGNEIRGTSKGTSPARNPPSAPVTRSTWRGRCQATGRHRCPDGIGLSRPRRQHVAPQNRHRR